VLKPDATNRRRKNTMARKKPTVTRTFAPIHFEDLDPHRFEDLVRQLVYDFKDWQTIEGTGRSGSDDGIDIRAFERLAMARSEEGDEEDGREFPHPMMGNLWVIQCKREKEIGPKRVGEIIDEIDATSPPYGYILAAACNFSKQSYDRFRDKLIEKGVMEFHLWGKAELEDMLCQPKNDHILFTFFGISLVTRRRSRSTEIRRTVANKNKLFKVLGTELGYVSVLIRGANDEHYPFKEAYKDFDRFPRWQEFPASGYHPQGLIVKTRDYFGYIDQEKREFDFTDAVSLLMLRGEEERDRIDWHAIRERVEDFWNHLPNRNKCHYYTERLLRYDDMLVIDDQGIEPHKFTHIFVSLEGKDGPFSAGWECAELRRNFPARLNVDLEGYRRKKVFPDEFPEPLVGTVYPQGAISIDSETARLVGLNANIRDFFLLDGQHNELKQRDVITLKPHDGRGPSRPMPTYLQITLIEKVRVADLYRDEEKQFRLRELEKTLGKELADDDIVNRVEFVETYARKIGKDDFT
jgi:Restriction endonuclease